MGSRIYLASGRYVDVEPAPSFILELIADRPADDVPTWLGFTPTGSTEPQHIVRVDQIETIVPLH